MYVVHTGAYIHRVPIFVGGLCIIPILQYIFILCARDVQGLMN